MLHCFILLIVIIIVSGKAVYWYLAIGVAEFFQQRKKFPALAILIAALMFLLAMAIPASIAQKPVLVLADTANNMGKFYGIYVNDTWSYIYSLSEK